MKEEGRGGHVLVSQAQVSVDDYIIEPGTLTQELVSNRSKPVKLLSSKLDFTDLAQAVSVGLINVCLDLFS